MTSKSNALAMVDTCRDASRKHLILCASAALIQATVISSERYYDNHAALKRVHEIAAPPPGSASDTRAPGEESAKLIQGAILNINGLPDKLSPQDKLVLSDKLAETEPSIEQIVSSYVSESILCTHASCPLTCPAPPASDAPIDMWLEYLAEPHYKIETPSTSEPNSNLSEAILANEPLLLALDRCETGEAYLPNEATLTIPLRSDDSRGRTIAIEYNQTLTFVGTRISSPIEKDTELAEAVQQLRTLDDRFRRQTIEDGLEALDEGSKVSSEAIPLLVVKLNPAFIHRFMTYALIVWAVFLAINFLRLRRFEFSDDDIDEIRACTWLPLFPNKIYLWTFIATILVAPMLAAEGALIALLIGAPTAGRFHAIEYVAGWFAGGLAAFSALWGLYPVWTAAHRHTKVTEPPPTP